MVRISLWTLQPNAKDRVREQTDATTSGMTSSIPSTGGLSVRYLDGQPYRSPYRCTGSNRHLATRMMLSIRSVLGRTHRLKSGESFQWPGLLQWTAFDHRRQSNRELVVCRALAPCYRQHGSTVRVTRKVQPRSYCPARSRHDASQKSTTLRLLFSSSARPFAVSPSISSRHASKQRRPRNAVHVD